MATRMGAAGHVDGLFDPINVRVMEFEPWKADNDLRVTEGGNEEGGSFFVSLKREKKINYLSNRSSFIHGAIDIPNRERPRESLSREFV